MIADGVFSHRHGIHMDPTGGLATAALIAGTVISGASAGYSVYSSNKQAGIAEDAADAQANEQKRMRDELLDKQRQEEASTAARDAKTRQRLAGSKLGRPSTILTSPVGLPQPTSYGGGTLLGGGKAA